MFDKSNHKLQTKSQLISFQFWYRRSHGGMILSGKPKKKIRRKTCPSASFSTINTTWIDPGLRGDRPATSRLSQGTAFTLR
jgi:hypothetical protein